MSGAGLVRGGSGRLPEATFWTYHSQMPQPTNAQSYSWGLEVLIERPECLAGIGLVAAQWSHVEASLSDLYMHVNGDFVQWPGDGALRESNSGTIDPNHLTVIDAVESLRARLSMISAMLKARGGKDLAAEFEVLVGEIRRRARERAKVVHGRWGTSQSHPDGLVLIAPRGEKLVRYTEADFRQIAERIAELQGKIVIFARKCEDEFRRPVEPGRLRYFSTLRRAVEEREGEFYLQGTSVTVDAIAALKTSQTDDQILEAYPALTFDQIQTAVEYVRSYPSAIRRVIAD